MKNKPLHHTDFNDWELTLLAMIECIKKWGERSAEAIADENGSLAGQFMWHETQQGVYFWQEADLAGRRPLQSKPTKKK